MMKFWGLIFIILAVEVRSELSCKDMDGKDVDWFIALKIPGLDKSYNKVHPDISAGTAFYYADSNNQEFRISVKNINDPQSALGYTVSQTITEFKASKKKDMYMFYNDQQPGNKDEAKKAHAKGIMHFNNDQGYWLLHSSPRYNDPTQPKYEFPTNARTNGQSFMCATFLIDQLKEISTQIFYSRFAVYQQNLPMDMAKKFPHLYHVMRMDATVPTKSKCPYFRNAALKTKGGQWLMNYEKNIQADSDIFANQLVEDKKQSFFVETWLNGNALDWQNQCTEPFTKNIRTLNHKKEGLLWRSSKDHSKWAVSDKPKTVCIGDINRQTSQRDRGGGLLCIENEKIWQFFRDSVEKPECCPGVTDASCEEMPSDSMAVPPGNYKAGDPVRERPKKEKPPKDETANAKPKKGKPAKAKPAKDGTANATPKKEKPPKAKAKGKTG